MFEEGETLLKNGECMYCECVCVLLSEIEKMYPRVHRKRTEISTT